MLRRLAVFMNTEAQQLFLADCFLQLGTCSQLGTGPGVSWTKTSKSVSDAQQPHRNSPINAEQTLEQRATVFASCNEALRSMKKAKYAC